MPKINATRTITVEAYTDIDGVSKFSLTSDAGVTHHYLMEGDEDTSIAEALKNLLDPISEE